MSRGVQDVDAVAIVVELEYGGCYGDSSFFFDFHPVGYGVTGGCFSFYASGEVDSAAVEKEFFSQGGFSGIGVGYDGEGSPFLNFFCVVCHRGFPPFFELGFVGLLFEFRLLLYM